VIIGVDDARITAAALLDPSSTLACLPDQTRTSRVLGHRRHAQRRIRRPPCQDLWLPDRDGSIPSISRTR